MTTPDERRGTRLHIGCGDKRLEGWVNIDTKPLPGVDLVADVNDGLDFDAVDAVFAEHFLEHRTQPARGNVGHEGHASIR